VPRPASRAEFLALTGWIPTARRPPPDGDDLDPLRSPGLNRALPGLAEALTSAAMAPRLQQLLADDWELVTCSPGKVVIEPGEGATLQYRLELRRRSSAETVDRVVAGRLFLSAESARAWMSDVAAMAGHLEGRNDLRAFARPAQLVPELRLVLHALPLDPALPGLVVATDPHQLVELLGPTLTSAVPGLELRDCRAEVVRYRSDGCVLRYELAWRLQSSRHSLKQVVYGKVYGDGRGRLVGPAVTALRRQAAETARGGLPFLVPRFQGYLPDLRLSLLEAVPGAPSLPALVRARRGGAAPAGSGLSAEAAAGACARVAAALHRSSIPVGLLRTLAEEVDAVRLAAQDLDPLAPALAATLTGRLDALSGAARERPGRDGVAHGDLTPSQVLFDGPTTSLVDFDTVCLAEPALDLGQFTGHLAVTVRGTQATAGATAWGEDLVAQFLGEYLRHCDRGETDGLLDRVDAYRTVSLARLAVRSWCQLRPQRVRPALALLDEARRSRVA
jgi:hypothetical protein